MSFKDAIVICLGKYATFSGRARRSEFWYFWLFNLIVNAILGVLAGWMEFFGLVASIYSLAVLVPTLAVSWRRLHDIGKGGGHYFFFLIPLVGWIFLLVWFLRDGQHGPNRFGPDPKGGYGAGVPWEY